MTDELQDPESLAETTDESSQYLNTESSKDVTFFRVAIVTCGLIVSFILAFLAAHPFKSNAGVIAKTSQLWAPIASLFITIPLANSLDTKYGVKSNEQKAAERKASDKAIESMLLAIISLILIAIATHLIINSIL